MAKVRDAIILAGGRGTRMLPASLYMPKETMPLVDTPILNHLVWEASRAGVERVHLVLSERKEELLSKSLDREFQSYWDGDRGDLPRDALGLGALEVEIRAHIQKRAGGVGDAISVALEDIRGPTLVLLGDNILLKSHHGPMFSGPEYSSNASLELVESYGEWGLPCAGILPVKSEDLSKYGVVGLDKGKICSIVEKPLSSEAPSSYVLCGRYLITEDASEILDRFPESEFGEMQSIAMLRYYIENTGLTGVKLEGYQMYDSGDPITWLKSQIDHGLRRDDISADLLEWISERIAKI